MKTANEFFTERKDENHTLFEWMELYSIEKSKYYVTAALKQAAEEIKSQFDFDGEWKSENYPEGIVNRKVKNSIINAYPLENIK